MKIILTIIILSLSVNSFAQWEPDVRLTNDPASSIRCFIGSNGNLLHVVWQENRDGNHELYYKRSTNKGISWSQDIRLTNDSNSSILPSIAVSGSFVHVVWQENRDGNNEIYYKNSTDSGNTWNNDMRLTNDPAASDNPHVSVSGTFVHVVWNDNRDGNLEIYYKHSTDNGATWSVDNRLTNDQAISINPKISSDSSSINIVWSDARYGAAYEIMYKRSTDNGYTWESDVRLTNDIYFSNLPIIAVNGLSVHVVWNDAGPGSELYYRRSINAGVTWDSITRLTFDGFASSHYPRLAIDYSNIHLVWRDSRDGEYEIFYKHSSDNGNSWGNDVRLTYDPFYSFNPDITLIDSTVHVVWYDTRDGNNEIYYKRNPTGNLVKITKINSEIPENYSLFQNYPNPFNPSTLIRYSIIQNEKVSLKVYNILGSEVATLINEHQNAGTYEVEWDASNYSSGVYFYKLHTAKFIETKKMVLTR